MNKNIAPIILFTYARPKHLEKTITTLIKNRFSDESDLYIFSDAAKSEKDSEGVLKTRLIINDPKLKKIFKSVTVCERNNNYGLSRNIIEGINEIASNNDKFIVLEDDIITSPFFLSFMNQALNHYNDNQNIWHISGWNYKLNSISDKELFFWRMMNCWGWATWSNKWNYYQKNPKQLAQSMKRKDIYQFNVDGAYNFWNQVERNISGELDSWAIFWYATIFQNNGFCLNPVCSYVDNIGLDGSGVNSKFSNKKFVSLNNQLPQSWPSDITEDKNIVSEIRKIIQTKKTWKHRLKALIFNS